ncbi:MAG: hypothetical protein RJA70_2177, partial [Pseudomonadota bacterium]
SEDDQGRFLKALLAREREAHTELFRRYYQRVVAVLQRVLGTDTELKDIAQDVFLHAFKGIGGFRGRPNQVESWLLGIAVLQARERIRRSQVSRRYIVAVGEPPEVEGRAAPKAEHLEALRCAYAVLDRMPVEERIALVLRDIDRMSHEEVAEVCRISVSTAKRRASRARERFEKLAVRDPVLKELLEERP